VHIAVALETGCENRVSGRNVAAIRKSSAVIQKAANGMKTNVPEKPRPEIDGRFPGGGSFYCSMSGTRIAPRERGSE